MLKTSDILSTSDEQFLDMNINQLMFCFDSNEQYFRLNKNTNAEDIKKEKFIIIISDFYYKDSALNLKKELSKKISLKNISIKKINDTKYRLLAGPFENFNALKTTYISLNNLGFEDLNIYHE